MVEFDGVHLRAGFQQTTGQRAEAGTDFEDDLPLLRFPQPDDRIEQIPIEQEILPEAAPRTHPDRFERGKQLLFVHRSMPAVATASAAALMGSGRRAVVARGTGGRTALRDGGKYAQLLLHLR